MKSVAAFRVALIEALKANPEVAAIVEDRVLDYVPPSSLKAPWLYLGSVTATQERSPCGILWNIRIRLYAVQTTFKADVAWDLLCAAWAALDGVTLTLPDGMVQTVPIEAPAVGDVFDPQQPANTFLDLTAMVAG